MVRTALVIAILLGGLVVDASAHDGQLIGTVRLHGCSARPNDFHLKARATGGGETGVARVDPTGDDSQQFSFVIDRLTLGETYLLSLHFNGSCGPVFWKGPAQGLVVAGGSPITIEGYAARTRIEILGDAVGRRSRGWVGADAIELDNPQASVRTIRVQTDLANVNRFVLQVATDPFVVTGDAGRRACIADGPSVVGTIEAAVDPVESPTQDGTGKHEQWTVLPPVDFHALLGLSRPLTDAAAATTAIDANSLKLLAAGAPLYIRAIAESVDASGTLRRRCSTDEDGISGWILIGKLPGALDALTNPAPPFPLKISRAKYVGPTRHPWPAPGDEMCVRAVEDHPLVEEELDPPFITDLWGFMYIKYKSSPTYEAGQTVPAGEHVCIPHSGGGGFLSDVLDAGGAVVTGVVDAVGLLVAQAGQLWDAVKKKVVSIAADVISAAGIPCESQCKDLLVIGLNVALTSCGVPPELPNLQVLKGDLRDYVATQIANQVAPGVPGSDVLAKEALKLADEALERYTKGAGVGGGGGLPSWLTLDTGLEPAVFYVTLEHLQAPPPPPIELLPDRYEAPRHRQWSVQPHVDRPPQKVLPRRSDPAWLLRHVDNSRGAPTESGWHSSESRRKSVQGHLRESISLSRRSVVQHRALEQATLAGPYRRLDVRQFRFLMVGHYHRRRRRAGANHTPRISRISLEPCVCSGVLRAESADAADRPVLRAAMRRPPRITIADAQVRGRAVPTT